VITLSKREFYYNKEIYEDIKSDENLVICARLGSGKSESVKRGDVK
jgi:hypothetical protein